MAEILLAENALEVVRGSSLVLELHVTEENDRGVEVDYDLTGSKIYFTVKKDAKDQFPLVQLTTDDPAQAVITKPRGGLVEIYLENVSTKRFDPGTLVYDVWVVTSADRRYPVIPPTDLIVTPGITLVS